MILIVGGSEIKTKARNRKLIETVIFDDRSVKPQCRFNSVFFQNPEEMCGKENSWITFDGLPDLGSSDRQCNKDRYVNVSRLRLCLLGLESGTYSAEFEH